MENGIAVVFLVKGAQEEISEWIREKFDGLENIVWFPLTEEDTFLRLIKDTELVKIAIYVVGGRGKLVFVAWDTLLFIFYYSFFLSFSIFFFFFVSICTWLVLWWQFFCLFSIFFSYVFFL